MNVADYSTRSEGIDYYYLIIRHVDRMSEGLKEGLDVGKVNTKTLVGYYQQVLHLESLLIPYLDEEYYEKRKVAEKKLPGYAKTWSGQISNQIEFFLAVSTLFRLLIVWAYKFRVLKIKVVREYKVGDKIDQGIMEGLFD